MAAKSGTFSTTQIRLPSLRGSRRGDQHVHVEVHIPRKLTARQRELIEQLGEELGTEIQPQPTSFLDRLRSFFD